MDSWKVAIQKNAKKRCKKHDMFWGSILREPKRKKLQKMKKTCFWSKSVFVCWGLIYKTADRPCHAFCKKSVIFGEPHFVTFPLENPWILITFGHFFDHFLTTFFDPRLSKSHDITKYHENHENHENHQNHENHENHWIHGNHDISVISSYVRVHH